MTAKILDAALVVLTGEGWRGLSVDKVAARAGVAVTTVYRRYPGVGDLLLALVQRGYDDVPVPDTGDVRADLVALLQSAMNVWSPPHEQRRSYLAALVAAMDEHETIATAYREQLDRRRAHTRAVIERGQRRGQIAPDVDADLVLDLLAGLLAQLVLLRRASLDPDLPTTVIDMILPGLQRTRSPHTPTSPGSPERGQRSARPYRHHAPVDLQRDIDTDDG